MFPSQPTTTWLEHFKLEHDNLRAALQWCITERRHPLLGARLAAALGRYWFERGLFREGRLWLMQSLEAHTDPIDPYTDAKIRLYLAFAANYESDYLAGEAAAQEALTAYMQTNDRAGAAQARNALGIAAMYTGRYLDAERYFGESLFEHRALEDRRGIAVALHNLGEIAAEFHSDFPTARARFVESLAIFRELEHMTNVACTLGVLSEMAVHLGEIDEAVHSGREALAIHTDLGNRPLIAEEMARIGRCELLRGNVDDARRMLRSALEQMEISFNARHVARCFEAVAHLAASSGDPERGARFLGFSERVRDAHNIARSPALQREHARLVESIRIGLAAPDYDASRRRGYELAPEQAFSEARSL